jgi:nucleoside 2-deoxyribosyltransferase
MATTNSPNQSVLGTTTIDSENSPSSAPPKSYTYYHAGPLFTIAELHTNVLLSHAINTYSSGKFVPILPQDLEQRDLSPHSIRDEDLRALLSCDLALFTYDGSELDAGTVVEYMVAKVADIPAVILRTDFRGAGDQEGKGDSWNLMSSNWPRSVGVSLNAMEVYKASLARVTEKRGNADGRGIDEVARRVVSAMEELLKTPPRLPKELRRSVYEWIALMPGFKSGSDEENVSMMRKLCETKVEKGLL